MITSNAPATGCSLHPGLLMLWWLCGQGLVWDIRCCGHTPGAVQQIMVAIRARVCAECTNMSMERLDLPAEH